MSSENTFLSELNLYQKLRDEIASDPSLLKLAKRIYRKTMSSQSVRSYVKSVLVFTKFLGVSKPVKALKMNYDWQSMINEWIDDLIADGVSPGTIRTYVAHVKKWLKVNLSKDEWDKIDWREMELPSSWKVEMDKIPQKVHLKILVDQANEKGKAIITTAISSGLRIGTLIKLKIGNLKVYLNGEIKSILEYLDKPLPENALGLIIISPEITKERVNRYLTFTTREALRYILDYLRKRRSIGEKLNENSVLFKSSRLKQYKDSDSATKFWRKLLAITGLKDKARKFHIYRFHSLRKYFSTWCRLAGINPDICEFMLGHKQGVKSIYNLFGDPTNIAVISKLAEEYRKAIPALTIFTEEEKIRELEKRIEEEVRKREEEIK